MEKCLASIRAEKRFVNRIGSRGDAQRQIARRQRLREAQDIGRHLRVFTRKHAARAAETGEDFIGDQQHAVAVAQPSHAGQEFDDPVAGEDPATAGEWIQFIELWARDDYPGIDRYVFAPGD